MNKVVDQNSKKKSKTSTVGIGIAVFIVVIIIWGLGWYLIDTKIFSSEVALSNEAARGVFGDKFGAVNALFSGLAFTGIIWTLILQKEEIAEQNLTISRQRFETTVFQLLNLHSSIVEKLLLKSYRGQEAFAYFIELLKLGAEEFRIFHALKKLTQAEIYQIHANKILPQEALSKLDAAEQGALNADIAKNFDKINKFESTDDSYHSSVVNAAYAAAHNRSQDGLSHYFRNLYHIFKYIDDSNIEDEEKQKYVRIVRAQLSDNELVAIFYNCIAITDAGNGLELGYPKMTYFAEKYSILQNINKYSLIHDHHQNIFDVRVAAAKNIVEKGVVQ
jgi:hypothetical protein